MQAISQKNKILNLKKHQPILKFNFVKFNYSFWILSTKIEIFSLLTFTVFLEEGFGEKKIKSSLKFIAFLGYILLCQKF
jgi:hypothetical protein